MDRLQLRRQEFVKRNVGKVGESHDSGGGRQGQGEMGKDGKSRVLPKTCPPARPPARPPASGQMSCQGSKESYIRTDHMCEVRGGH